MLASLRDKLSCKKRSSAPPGRLIGLPSVNIPLKEDLPRRRSTQGTLSSRDSCPNPSDVVAILEYYGSKNGSEGTDFLKHLKETELEHVDVRIFNVRVEAATV